DCGYTSVVIQTPSVTVAGQATRNSAPAAPLSSGSGGGLMRARYWTVGWPLAVGDSAVTRLLARPSATGSPRFAAGEEAAASSRPPMPAERHQPCTVAAGVSSEVVPVANCNSPTSCHSVPAGGFPPTSCFQAPAAASALGSVTAHRVTVSR